MDAIYRLKTLLSQAGIRQPLIILLIMRIFLSLWAALALTLNPLPGEPDEKLRPYLGEFVLSNGAAGLLLGAWQRFDTLHYLRIARQGYVAEDSVFPPLYPMAMRGLGEVLALVLRPTAGAAETQAISYLLAGLIWSSLACLGSLVLLHRVATVEVGAALAKRTLVYLVLFPTGFFLFAAYTEPVFLLFALGSVWAARRGHPWMAGALGLLAALTRLTGWTLTVPLIYEYVRRRDFDLRRLDWAAPAALLPPLGLAAFLGWRQWAGLPPIAQVYAEYWRQQAGWPWADLLAGVDKILTGQATFVLIFNLMCAGLLIAATVMVWRRLPPVYGLYMTALLVFTLMTVSQGRPLNALSRYMLVFFPAFMWLGQLGQRPWLNRLILYPSLALFLYFSGQFFIWGWVA